MTRALLFIALLLSPGLAWAQSNVTINCLTGTSSTGVPIPQPASAAHPCPVTGSGSVFPIVPGNLTIVPLDAATVVTGGTAVSASLPGNHNRGGFLLNPVGATINLCINEQATASGTTTAGALICVTPGQFFNITPNATSTVSVVSSDSAHPFGGETFN